MPRFHCAAALAAGRALQLPAGAARHVQVLRMQPGDALTLFDGRGGEYEASIERMGRSEVSVQVGRHHAVEREAPLAVHLAVGMPANERMDWLVEKATELGVASIQPLMAAHGVLRLAGERAEKKRSHWEAIAVAACEQCGRNRVPQIHPVQALAGWLDAHASQGARFVLSLGEGACSLRGALARMAPDLHEAWVLSGPEGGLSAAEEQAAIGLGFAPLTLGPRVLRAETAALAALAGLAGASS
ncbi:MAG TPA: 16S rRNA (uracil(1498)-N(3))-methyltransferase [Variovorax sp.]